MELIVSEFQVGLLYCQEDLFEESVQEELVQPIFFYSQCSPRF